MCSCVQKPLPIIGATNVWQRLPSETAALISVDCFRLFGVARVLSLCDESALHEVFVQRELPAARWALVANESRPSDGEVVMSVNAYTSSLSCLLSPVLCSLLSTLCKVLC